MYVVRSATDRIGPIKTIQKPTRKKFDEYKPPPRQPAHKSCKPKQDAYFVKMTPTFMEEGHHYSGTFLEHVPTLASEFADWVKNGLEIDHLGVRGVDKPSYAYMTVTTANEGDAVKLRENVHGFVREGRLYWAEIIKGFIDKPGGVVDLVPNQFGSTDELSEEDLGRYHESDALADIEGN